MIGRTLGQYRIVEPLGAGGMGEVYRAHDEKLDRDVALKVLPEGALADEDARARFRREAKALSRLSHPHIAALFDFDTAEGIDFLVMELVRGPSLKEEAHGPERLSEQRVIRLAAQIALGLQAAHGQGVIHRDLKPSNLQLTPDGLIKILDFGLARLTAPVPGEVDEADLTQTAAGHGAGTLPYMSPEQLRGRGVDTRTDLYSLGAVLYELTTGRRPFSRPSAAELTQAILGEEPAPPRALNGGLSPELESLILKALDKDPELRYQTAKELLVDLERLRLRADTRSATSHSLAPARTLVSSTARWRRPLAFAIAAAVALGLAWWLWPPAPPRVISVRALTGDLSLGHQSAGGGEVSLAVDAERAYYFAAHGDRPGVFQVPLSGGEPVEVRLPISFSRQIFDYVTSESALLMRGAGEPVPLEESFRVGAPLWWVPVPGGAPRRIGNLRAGYADLSPDGRVLAIARGHQLLIAGRDGSDERLIMELPYIPGGIRWAPDGRRLRFHGPAPEGLEVEWWIWEASTDGETPRPLWPGRDGSWTDDGRFYIFNRAQSPIGTAVDLFVVRESPWPPWREAPPQQLTSGPLRYLRPRATRDARSLVAFGQTPRFALMRLDRATHRFVPALAGESAYYAEPSPDGEWLAWVRYPDGTLWKSRPDGNDRLQLTGPPLDVHLPRWSPDGRRLAFLGWRPGNRRLSLHVASADGANVDLVARPAREGLSYWDCCWLPDGSIVFSYMQDASHPSPPGLLRLDPETHGVEPWPGAGDLRSPKCSRQGHVLAATDASALEFRLLLSGDDAWQELGTLPLRYPSWRKDGRSFCGLSESAVIECYSLETGRLEPLVEVKGFPLAGVFYGAWMGLDADDNPLVAADVSTSALYALEWEAP